MMFNIIEILLFCFCNESVKYASNGSNVLIVAFERVGIRLYNNNNIIIYTCKIN